MAHALGKPSLFITLTCNPHWREITAALEPGQTWEDRADVVNRVFQLKLRAFVQDVREGTCYYLHFHRTTLLLPLQCPRTCTTRSRQTGRSV